MIRGSSTRPARVRGRTFPARRGLTATSSGPATQQCWVPCGAVGSRCRAHPLLGGVGAAAIRPSSTPQLAVGHLHGPERCRVGHRGRVRAEKEEQKQEQEQERSRSRWLPPVHRPAVDSGTPGRVDGYTPIGSSGRLVVVLSSAHPPLPGVHGSHTYLRAGVAAG